MPVGRVEQNQEYLEREPELEVLLTCTRTKYKMYGTNNTKIT
jgi:hypothetical protein